MTVSATVTVLLGCWVLVEVWRARDHRDRASSVARWVPLLLVPAAAGITVGGWRLRGTLVTIAETGSGGVGQVMPAAYELFSATFIGLLVTLGLLCASALVAGRPPALTPPEPASASGWRRGGLLIIALASFVAVIPVILAAEQASAGLGAWMTGVAGGAMPVRYAVPANTPVGEMAARLQGLLHVVTIGGTTLLAGLAAAAAFSARRSGDARMPTRMATAVLATTIVILVAGGWYAVHMQAVGHSIFSGGQPAARLRS